MENKEITEILRVFKITLGKDLANIEGISTGSFYKNKDDILNETCSQARSAKRFLYMITSCLSYLNDGFSFKQWIDSQLDEINRTNQPEQDRLDLLKDVKRLEEEFINI